MSDFKSKLPDLKELGEISGKLFRDLKTSISEIITNYKQKHPSTTAEPQKKADKPNVKTASAEKAAEPVTENKTVQEEPLKKPKASAKATGAAKKEDE